jgi:hypothetical protein
MELLCSTARQSNESLQAFRCKSSGMQPYWKPSMEALYEARPIRAEVESTIIHALTDDCSAWKPRLPVCWYGQYDQSDACVLKIGLHSLAEERNVVTRLSMAKYISRSTASWVHSIRWFRKARRRASTEKFRMGFNGIDNQNQRNDNQNWRFHKSRKVFNVNCGIIVAPLRFNELPGVVTVGDCRERKGDLKYENCQRQDRLKTRLFEKLTEAE